MESCIWIAKFFAPMFQVTATPMIVTPQVITELTGYFLKNRALIFVSGLLVLDGGLAIVSSHHRW